LVLDDGQLGDRGFGWRLSGRLNRLEFADLGMPRFAPVGILYQDRLKIQDLNNAETPALDGDPDIRGDRHPASHGATHRDSLNHIRLCIVSG
jgi:hypothetical protein